MTWQIGPLLGFGRRRTAITDISLSFHSLYVSLSFSLVKRYSTFTTEIQELFKTGLSQYAAVHGYKYGSADLDFPDLLVKPSLPAANVEIVSVENHANMANAVIVNWRYLCESCVAGGNDRMACHAGSTGVNCNPKTMRCFTSANCDDFWNMLFNHKSQSTVATKLVDFLKTTMTDLTDADNAYENQVSGSQVGPQVIYKYVVSDDDDKKIKPIDISLFIGLGVIGLISVIHGIKGLRRYCLANGLDMDGLNKMRGKSEADLNGSDVNASENNA